MTPGLWYLNEPELWVAPWDKKHTAHRLGRLGKTKCGKHIDLASWIRLTRNDTKRKSRPCRRCIPSPE